jgi:hypothetical protein
MASSHCRRKRCRFCKELFRPDPRLKSRQVACSRPECQSARKKENRESWLARHPDYFTGRSANTKAWRQHHPDYQRYWRRKHPEVRARDNARRRRRRELADLARAEIQNSILLQEPIRKAVTPYLVLPESAEIQNSILPQIVSLSIFSVRFAAHLWRRDTRLDRQGDAASVPSQQEVATATGPAEDRLAEEP